MQQEPPTGHVYVDARLAPEGHAALEHLREAGYRVILLGDAPHAADDPAQPAIAAFPAGAEGWLVTGDAAVCTRARELRRLRTVLVGPTMQGRGLAHRPADTEARDLLDAVLTILVAGAMPGDARAE